MTALPWSLAPCTDTERTNGIIILVSDSGLVVTGAGGERIVVDIVVLVSSFSVENSEAAKRLGS